jgi:LAO/AO transport system kinase
MLSAEAEGYVKGVLGRNNRILAKTITLVESVLPSRQQLAREIVEHLLPRRCKAVRLGITGVPGVGKSTFIESLGMYLVGRGHRLAVLAVDPSSARSGGSILADKTRMERLSAEENAFIRPSPSGGTLGGVASRTRETMAVCEAAGYDVIIVETVGVGQSETAVASMVDFFLVLMLAGAGDELQGIKKGILELADAIAINKADGDNLEKARRARREYENALHYLSPASPHWNPPVLTCSALNSVGIEEVWSTVMAHHRKLEAVGELQAKRRLQSLAWMWTLLEEGLKERFHQHPAVQRRLPEVIAAVQRGACAPTRAASDLLFLLDKDSDL